MADKKPYQHHCTKCSFAIGFKLFRKKNHVSRWVIQCSLFDEEVPIWKGLECPEFNRQTVQIKEVGPVFEFQERADIYTIDWLIELRYKCNI